MKKTIYIIFLLTGIMAISIAMTACSNPAKAENVNLSEEVERVTHENQQLKEEILQLQQNNQKLDEEIEKLDPSKVDKDNGSIDKEAIFNIYGANVDTYEKEPISQITIKDNIALEEKLSMLADDLSEVQFGDLDIDILKIENQDGKKIAMVNLTEDSDENDASWKKGYFQGSTGGIVTTISLEETFLQKEYDGEWIDGVKFLYNMETIEFDHVEPLRDIIYR